MRSERPVHFQLFVPRSEFRAFSHFHLVVDKLGHRVAPQRLDNFLQGDADRIRFAADQGDPEDCHSRVIEFLDLGNRDVEAVAKLVLDALHDLPLVLQGPGLTKQQAYFQGTDNHSSWWVVGW